MIEDKPGNNGQQDGTHTVEVIPQSVAHTHPVTPDAPPIKDRPLPKRASDQITQADTGKRIQPEGEGSEVKSEVKKITKRELKPFEKQTIRLTILGILVAILTGVILYSQLSEMTHQTEILASQTESAAAGGLLDQMNTRKQLQIAQVQANAAQDSVRATQGQMRQEQRAWLAITPQKPNYSMEASNDPPPTPWPPISTDVNIKNTGRTPALHLTGWARLQRTWLTGSIGQDKPDFSKGAKRQTTPIDIPILNADETAVIRLYGPRYHWPDEMKDEHWINGEIDYCDVYNEQHFVNFCFELLATGNPVGLSQYISCNGTNSNRIDDTNSHRKCHE